ncbi:hypothetical protein [Geodermatophilus sp. SYSU D01036]
MSTRRWATLLFSAALVLAAPTAATAVPPAGHPGEAEVLVSGLEGATGSTVGPDGALYVTEGAAGRITRIDLRSGATTTFADCLPRRILPNGGAMDVAFIGRTAYALVTLVDQAVRGTAVSGVYRIDGPRTCTVVADVGAWSTAHPPDTTFTVASGLQYAFEPLGDGFVVTDGHHDRVLYVTVGGAIGQLVQLPNDVPTGLAIVGHTLYLAEAGPVPHLPETGRIVAFALPSPTPPGDVVASGGPLLVDVEPGHGHRLFALAQGHFTPGQPAGAPADPGTGLLLRVDRDGGFDVVVDHLDRPTSLEVVRNTAYVVVAGGVVRVHGLSAGGSRH